MALSVALFNHMEISADAFNFDSDGNFCTENPTPAAYFVYYPEEDYYQFENEAAVSAYLLNGDGYLSDLVASDAVSDTNRKIYKRACPEIGDWMESEAYLSGEHLYLNAILCLRSADRSRLIPIMFSMEYGYNCAKKCVEAWGSVRNYKHALIPNSIEDRYSIILERQFAVA